MIGRCVLLLVAASAICAEARLLETSATRHLLLNERCPAGCNIAGGGCVADATTGGYRCALCLGKLVINGADGTCGCPPGRYAAEADTCTDCPKGAWCAGGTYAAVGTPDLVNCTTDLTTIGKRSISIKSCVNMAGYFYSADASGVPTATVCPINTFSAGLRKQRACVPCSPGYTTNSLTGQSRASACVVPEGYYLKGPGQVAPCPRGEYKTGVATSATCTKCATGVTTPNEASTAVTDCSMVLPSYYPATRLGTTVTSAAKCPQKYYCVGGAVTGVFTPGSPNPATANQVAACPDATWTKGIGATSGTECMTPPGYKTTISGGSGTTDLCLDGYYRAEWKVASAAGSCDSCGEGIHSNTTDQITAYDISTAAESVVPIRGSKGACFIKPGQGMYFSPASGTYKGANCETNNYGAAKATFGLAAFPCRDCPAGMQATVGLTNSDTYWATDGATSQGFTSPMACVTRPGFGYNGRVANKCPAGSYNAEGNYDTCTKCPVGLSTPNTAADQVVISNCTVAPGYGSADGVVQPCPVGTYNDALRSNNSAACTPCDAGVTTSQEGADAAADCNVCLAGYGGASCTTCGGVAATYGPAGQADKANCITCPDMSTGFTFDYNGTNLPFTPASVARSGAASAGECLAEFAQIVDSAWYLGGATALTTVSGANTFAACVAACTGTCQYITFDYDAADDSKCSKKVTAAGDGGALVAYKAVVTGDVTEALSVKNNKAKGLGSGSYTFWTEGTVTAATIGTQTDAPAWTATTNTVQQCLDACNTDGSCAAVVMTGTRAAMSDKPNTCKLVKGVDTVAQFKRSLTKAVVSQLIL